MENLKAKLIAACKQKIEEQKAAKKASKPVAKKSK